MRLNSVMVLVTALIFAIGVPAAAADPASLVQVCTGCHGPQGQGDPSQAAPRVAGMPQWYLERQLLNFMKGRRGGSEIDIAAHSMLKKSSLFQTDEDIDAVVRHLASLPIRRPAPTIQGNPERGEKFYQYCSGCHGAGGTGNKRLGVPPIAAQHDWYLAKQILAFRSRQRTNHPDQTTSGEMAPMTLLLPNQRAVDDVVSYINTLETPRREPVR